MLEGMQSKSKWSPGPGVRILGITLQNANSHQKHFLDVAQGEVEADIKPNRVRDDFWWKTVVLVADDHTHVQQLRKISNPSNRPELM